MTHILLIEDDEEICEIIQFYLLERSDFQVTCTHSAENALQLASRRPFDLFLVDIMLPGMNGITFCEKLRSRSF